MRKALYRAYRPDTFADVLGQEHIVRILKNQIETDSVSHAYLFCGTRGTGKTTTARILAKGVNCEADEPRPCGVCATCEAIRDGVFVDVIEIDAASHNGVENIRELRESVKYPPAAGREKVYIIDEVHMLSTGAFNALLKTLEEPPDNVVFILATTEPQKLPATILSRCMRLDFRRVPESLLKAGMEKICADIGVNVSEPALKLIAINADGSVRDGLSILEQCLASGEKNVSRDDVLALLGASGEEVFAEMTAHAAAGRVDAALLLFDRALSDGKDARQFMKDWLAYYRNLLIAKFVQNPGDILNLSSENAEKVRARSEDLTLAEINRAIVDISAMAAEARWSTQPRILAELCIVNLAAKEGEPARTAKAEAPRTEPAKKARDEAPEPPGTESVKAEEPAEKARIEAPEPSRIETGELWERLFRGEDGLTGSLNVIRNAARIDSVSETEWRVATRSETIQEVIEKNRTAIEDALEKRSGFRRTVKCVREEAPKAAAAKPIEELAEELESKLGISIEIEGSEPKQPNEISPLNAPEGQS